MNVLLKELLAAGKISAVNGRCPVPHGYRSTFSDWAAKAKYSAELREMALAHSVGDSTFRAYKRDQLTELRRPMMQKWSKFAMSAV
jgi:integrase